MSKTYSYEVTLQDLVLEGKARTENAAKSCVRALIESVEANHGTVVAWWVYDPHGKTVAGADELGERRAWARFRVRTEASIRRGLYRT